MGGEMEIFPAAEPEDRNSFPANLFGVRFANQPGKAKSAFTVDKLFVPVI